MDAPESMVSIYMEQIKDDLKKRNQQFDEQEMKENYQSHAEWNIKWYLIKDLIIEKEDLDISDAELNSKINEMITNNKENEDRIIAYFKDSHNKNNLYNEILNDKLFERLSDYAKVKVVDQSTNELRKKEAA